MTTPRDLEDAEVLRELAQDVPDLKGVLSELPQDAPAASLTATAAAGVAAPPRCPGASSGGVTNVLASPHTPGGGTGQHTLHVEYAVWSGSYRIIHTKPDGRREVWRRGIETVEEARLRCLYVEELLGYEARL